jgi:hypothetical protein
VCRSRSRSSDSEQRGSDSGLFYLIVR